MRRATPARTRTTGVRAAQKEQTRYALLRCALRLMEHQSLSSLSLREVSRAAGIVPAGFYRHFRDMDELGVTLVEECLVPLRAAMRAVRAGFEDSDQIIERSMRVLASEVLAHPDQFRFLARERYGGVRQVRAAIHDELHRFAEELAGDLIAVGERGDARLDQWPVADLAMFTHLVVNQMVLTAAALLDQPPGEPGAEAMIVTTAATQLRLIVVGARHWLDPA